MAEGGVGADELVWEAMTNPKHVVNWWGPRGFTTTIEEMDVRVGGVWKHVMHGPDGTNYPNQSTFTEVTKPERISYKHGGCREGGPGVTFEATWTFEETEPGQTKLTLRQVFPSAEARERVVREFGAIEGGKQTFQRLAEHLVQIPVTLERTFHAPIALVWDAITQGEHLRHWFVDTLVSFQPTVGFETEFKVAKESRDFLHQWKVTEVVPERKIAYEWKIAGSSTVSHLTMELSPEGSGTRLRLTHADLQNLEPCGDPTRARGNFVKGWNHFIHHALRSYVEKTAPPFGEGMFVITRIFNAPRELVFEAWTNPEHVPRWWGPQGFTAPHVTIDLRPGGSFHFCMRSPEGKEYWNKGVFHEVVVPERITSTIWFSDAEGRQLDATHYGLPDNVPKEMKDVVLFEEMEGNKTRLTIHRDTPIALAQSFMMDEGWSSSLEKFAQVVEAR